MTFLMRARRILFYSVFLVAFIYSCWVILFKYAPDFTKPDIIYAGPIAGMLALFLAALKTHDVMLNKFEDENIKNYSDLLLKNVLCLERLRFHPATTMPIIKKPCRSEA